MSSRGIVDRCPRRRLHRRGIRTRASAAPVAFAMTLAGVAFDRGVVRLGRRSAAPIEVEAFAIVRVADPARALLRRACARQLAPFDRPSMLRSSASAVRTLFIDWAARRPIAAFRSRFCRSSGFPFRVVFRSFFATSVASPPVMVRPSASFAPSRRASA